MTPRLSQICALIDKTESFIDVGCDHGYVTEYAVRRRLARKIAACDCSAPSLEKAKKRIGSDSGVEFLCADGKDAAAGYETVVIGGLGGREIISIFASITPETLILSPQSHVREVREALLTRDYRIEYDAVTKSGRKYYDILKACKGGGKTQKRTVCSAQLSYGIFANTPRTALTEKLRNMRNTLLRLPSTEENARKIQEIEEVLSWQLR